ncbi:hypothetical protein CKAN_02587200 [Cinnamomum micranthum f. kanehirae]|uniref:Uncharacterized protein n=1 Tax=Cinnamomum micranthum f. kanehirae TaxID=337451 RepID=A0A3S3R9I2_9MAGN|nr:hypothetical protein CKAN_02587200 [Cinnamomum micranthum f. kanehirae]
MQNPHVAKQPTYLSREHHTLSYLTALHRQEHVIVPRKAMTYSGASGGKNPNEKGMKSESLKNREFNLKWQELTVFCMNKETCFGTSMVEGKERMEKRDERRGNEKFGNKDDNEKNIYKKKIPSAQPTGTVHDISKKAEKPALEPLWLKARRGWRREKRGGNEKFGNTDDNEKNMYKNILQKSPDGVHLCQSPMSCFSFIQLHNAIEISDVPGTNPVILIDEHRWWRILKSSLRSSNKLSFLRTVPRKAMTYSGASGGKNPNEKGIKSESFMKNREFEVVKQLTVLRMNKETCFGTSLVEGKGRMEKREYRRRNKKFENKEDNENIYIRRIQHAFAESTEAFQ